LAQYLHAAHPRRAVGSDRGM